MKVLSTSCCTDSDAFLKRHLGQQEHSKLVGVGCMHPFMPFSWGRVNEHKYADMNVSMLERIKGCVREIRLVGERKETPLMDGLS